jgi:hypothetical protein
LLASGGADLDDLKASLVAARKRTMNSAVCLTTAGADGRAGVAKETERLAQRNAAQSPLCDCTTALGLSFFNDAESSIGFASLDVAATARKYRAVTEKVLI